MADSQLLMKLAYGPSYVKDGNRALHGPELMRLLVLADRFQMHGAVGEFASAMKFVGYDDARAYLSMVPEPLYQRKELWAITNNAIYELTVVLGLVEDWWQPGPEELGLDQRVAVLPLWVMDRLLRDDCLLIRSENSTFSLALSWAKAQPGPREEQHRMLNHLLKGLRCSRMSAPFLAAITYLDWVQNSGLLPAIVSRGLGSRDDSGQAYWEHALFRVGDEHKPEYTATLTTSICKAPVEALIQGGADDKYIIPWGVLHGFPCNLELTWVATHREVDLSLTSPLLADESALNHGRSVLDAELSLNCTPVSAMVGAISIPEDAMLRWHEKYSQYLVFWKPDWSVFDAEGKARVEMVVKVTQHKTC